MDKEKKIAEMTQTKIELENKLGELIFAPLSEETINLAETEGADLISKIIDAGIIIDLLNIDNEDHVPLISPFTSTSIKSYNLTTKDGEVISKTTAYSLFDAIQFFSNRKVLSMDDLLEIYNVRREK